ncbi:Repressor of RNA polymerase III transcription MAF1 [Seminavis robusta]|uniref:Repressor of RNA polymerase III transcription n=1 Tax=Seminavis robusta TaxID=568900 RepID=A0A9N8E8I4_9STRA|nr:Repressor of RNA polymerase III transcription MAF1 [Seminavis robusta]|eukprot:Sro665_g183870.1 Repressor of RNA polymerase III transcription MAF1 (358) ;mRNA; f:32843-33916
MKYLEDEKLTKLTSELTDATLGRSRSIHGRIEAYIMKRAGTDKKYAHALGRSFVAEMESVENQLADYKVFMERHIKADNNKKEATKSRGKGRKRSVSVGSSVEARPKKQQRRRRSSSYDDTMNKIASAAPASTVTTTTTTTTTTAPKPLGDFGEIGTRRLMTDLILTLNASFPDYDFASIRPSDFEKIQVNTAIKRINERLSELAAEKGAFLQDMWASMDDVVGLSDCDVYSYAPKARDEDDDPLSFLTQTLIEDAVVVDPDDGLNDLHHDNNSAPSSSSSTVLWSFNFFFVNKSQKRIVFFTCVERMRNEGSLLQQEDLLDDEVDYVRFHGTEASDVDFDMDPSAHIAGGIPIPIM